MNPFFFSCHFDWEVGFSSKDPLRDCRLDDIETLLSSYSMFPWGPIVMTDLSKALPLYLLIPLILPTPA
jgi:hypothetical protein